MLVTVGAPELAFRLAFPDLSASTVRTACHLDILFSSVTFSFLAFKIIKTRLLRFSPYQSSRRGEKRADRDRDRERKKIKTFSNEKKRKENHEKFREKKPIIQIPGNPTARKKGGKETTSFHFLLRSSTRVFSSSTSVVALSCGCPELCMPTSYLIS